MPPGPQSTTLERETEGCYLSRLPACRPDLGHPVPLIANLFHPHQLPNGGTDTQKKPRKCQLGRVRGAPGRERWAGPGRIILALTQEIWGRGGLGRFEMYDSMRASQSKG